MISLILIILYYSMFIYGNIFKGTTLTVINIMVFGLLMILSIYFNLKLIKKDLKSFNGNIKKNIKPIIKCSVITLIGYIIATVLVGVLVKTNSINKDTVADSNLLQVFFNLLIWAPITEELIFRAQLKKDVGAGLSYVIFSSFLFAEVHVLGNGFNINSMISMIPYLVLGIYLALLYNKTDNIIINMLMHLLINVVGVIMILIMI